MKKNILTAKEGIILQGVNCQGIMGSGLALDIKTMYPKVYTEYKEFVEKFCGANDRKDLLGKVHLAQVGPKLWVANCFTQYFYGKVKPLSGSCHLDYNALEKCLNTLFSLQMNLPLHLPKIGCGLAGGDWKIVKEIIEKFEIKYGTEVLFYEI